MLSELRKRKLARLFNYYDSNDDGFLTQEDWDRKAQALAQKKNLQSGTSDYETLQSIYSQEWERLKKFADINHDGKVSLDEWFQFIDSYVTKQGWIRQLGNWVDFMFKLVDTDGNGGIDIEEFKVFYMSEVSDEALTEEVFAKLDLDSNGYIDKDEMFQHLQDFYESDDPEAPGNFIYGPY